MMTVKIGSVVRRLFRGIQIGSPGEVLDTDIVNGVEYAHVFWDEAPHPHNCDVSWITLDSLVVLKEQAACHKN
ncbi:MAG: hypothetical protein WCA07_09555 [Gloeobacterales cyanobacterium]